MQRSKKAGTVALCLAMLLSTTAAQCKSEPKNTSPLGCKEKQDYLRHWGDWCKRWTGETPGARKGPQIRQPKEKTKPCTPGDKRLICG